MKTVDGEVQYHVNILDDISPTPPTIPYPKPHIEANIVTTNVKRRKRRLTKV